jgi:hypothetical protein
VSRPPTRWAVVAAAAVVVGIGIGAFFAYGNTARSGSTADQVRSWVDGTGLGQSIGTVVGDAARVREALAAHRGAGVLHTDCGVLLTDAQSANGELPAPDSELTDLLSSGYALAYDAGYDCYNSGGTNAALVAKANTERIKAEAKLQQAVNLVGQLLGSTLSTTTTTQPGNGFFGS